MNYDQLFDALCDVIIESDSAPQDVLDAVLAVLLVALHKAPDRELGFAQVEQIKRVYNETFGALMPEPENDWVH